MQKIQCLLNSFIQKRSYLRQNTDIHTFKSVAYIRTPIFKRNFSSLLIFQMKSMVQSLTLDISPSLHLRLFARSLFPVKREGKCWPLWQNPVLQPTGVLKPKAKVILPLSASHASILLHQMLLSASSSANPSHPDLAFILLCGHWPSRSSLISCD